MKALLAITILITFLAASCSENEEDRLNQENVADNSMSFSSEEVDEIVEEALPNYGTPKPIEVWFGESVFNQIDFLNREDALAIYRKVKADFGIELKAVVSHKNPRTTHSIVGRLRDDLDLSSLKESILESESGVVIEVEFSSRWVWLSGKIVGDGDESYLKKL